MKLRIENQNVRFRLSPEDIALLEKEGTVSQSIQVSPLITWQFSIEGAEVAQPVTAAEAQSLRVQVPQSQLSHWLGSHEIEWNFKVDRLVVDIEKDLKPRRQPHG